MTDLPTQPLDPLVVRLRADVVAGVGGGMLLLLAGLALSVAAAWAVTIVLWLAVGLPGLGFTGWSLLILAVYGGLAAAWLSKRPTLLSGRPFAYLSPTGEWAEPGAYDGPLAVSGVAADWACLGPRMATAGAMQAADREPPTRERFFDRCALLLRQLAKAGEAVPLAAVQVGEDETPDKLRPVLDYLDRARWIGMNSDRSKIWLSSRAKEDLVRMGIIVPVAPS